MIPRAILKPWISAQVSLSSAAKVGSARSRRRKAATARSSGFERLESRQILTTIDLATLTASQGMSMYATAIGDNSGDAVSSAGDFNGDGYDDLIVGSKWSDLGFTDRGASFLVFGGPSLPGSLTLGANLGTAGLTIIGGAFDDLNGTSVSAAGDVNGDGFADLIVGSPGFDVSGPPLRSNAGASYIVFGSNSLSGALNLASLGSNGVRITGVDASDTSGDSVSGAGDLNGDGFDDIIIGAKQARSVGNARGAAGESYVIFGAAVMPTGIDLSVSGSADMTIFGAEGADACGSSVSAAGDVNGDGFGDLLIGAIHADGPSNARNIGGESYLIFGSASLPSTIDLAVAGTADVTFYGAYTFDLSGSVRSAGDVNGDGYGDVLIGSAGGDGASNLKGNAGNAYLVYGAATMPATIDLRTLGSAGVTIFGADPSDASSTPGDQSAISGGGDINGDGFDDLIIGFRYADAAGNAKSLAGETVVIFGGSSMPTSIDLANPANADITIYGADAGDFSGFAVSLVGDTNGDGFADFLIGAPTADGPTNTTNNSGNSYLIYGGNGFTSSVTHPGTSASETLNGTTAADIMVGGRGNDTLNGNGGMDVLLGGQGDDVHVVTSLPFARIDGGNGFDTLRLNGSGLTLDLTTPGNAKIQNIEEIDLSGTGNNTLVLNHLAVQSLSDESNELIVRRNADDVITIGGGWTQGTNQAIGSVTFNVYTQQNATLLIQVGQPVGTSGDDAFVLTYTGTTLSGSVVVTVSTNGGPVTNLGTFPMNAPLTVDGLGGMDSVRVVATSGADTYLVTGSSLTVNGSSLSFTSIEARTLAGAVGNDLYQFDADTPLGVYSLVESGAGADTIDFSMTTLAVALNLGVATTQVVNANLSLNLGAVNTFENATGGSGNDALTGNSLANVLTGRDGNDTLNGARGHDSLLGGTGDDTYLFGAAATAEADSVTELPGEGIDRLSFTSLTTAVVLNLSSTAVQNIHTNRTLQLNSGGTFENASGGSGNDVLTGNELNNILIGGSGIDTLNGMAGNDTLLGGLGDDIYIFFPATSAEADQVTEYSSQGTDILDFGTLTTSVNLNLGSIAVQPIHANRTLQLNSGITFENATGGSGNDSLTGNTLNNILVGAGGNDTLTGGAGNDSMFGGLGDDAYNFNAASVLEADAITEQPGEGIDRLSFTTLTTAVVLDLSSAAVQTIHTNRTLQLNSGSTFENATGGSGNDVLTGNALNNILIGGSGSDMLNGMAGNDTMLGGLGDDTYVFSLATSAEADLVTEYTNQGNDLLNFATLTTSVNLNLGTSAVQAIHTNRTLQLASSVTVENATGGSSDDILLGNTLSNVLTGGDGNDVLVGSSGDDQMFGGNGRDILTGGLGLDTLDGGSDDDILIGGRTNSDTSITRLTDLRTEWTSANSYATRIVNLRAGVGASNASLKATINVLNDAGEDDVLTGGSDTDWFFAALDDVITDLFAGEVLDVL